MAEHKGDQGSHPSKPYLDEPDDSVPSGRTLVDSKVVVGDQNEAEKELSDFLKDTTLLSHHNIHGHKHHEHIPGFAVTFVHAFNPIQYFLTLVGQFPIHKSYHAKDGTYIYRFDWYRPEALWYYIMMLVQLVLILVMAYNTTSIFSQRQYFDSRPRSPSEVNQTELYESVLLARYRHTFITIWISLLFAFTTQVRLLNRVRYLEEYFGYWTRTAQRHHLNVGKGIWKVTLGFMGGYAIFIVTLAFLYLMGFSASFRGVPSLMAIMMFKMLQPDMLTFDDRAEYETFVRSPQNPYLPLFQHIGAATFVLILIWSKSVILIFIFKAKLLTTAFELYNQRVYSVIIKGKSHHEHRGKLSAQLLFKEHCCILDLLEATDQLFSSIFEPFMGLHVIGFIHEVYYLFLNLGQQDQHAEFEKSFDNQYFARPHDYLFSSMMVFHYIFYIVYVSLVACGVGEEAMGGLEVLRRSSMIARESDEDLFFHFSMFQSFSGRDDGCLLRCGEYFRINKQFIAGMFGIFLGYYIILQQFHPKFEYEENISTLNRGQALVFREKVGKFLFRLENLAYCHWVRHEHEPCPFPELPGSNYI